MVFANTVYLVLGTKPNSKKIDQRCGRKYAIKLKN